MSRLPYEKIIKITAEMRECNGHFSTDSKRNHLYELLLLFCLNHPDPISPSDAHLFLRCRMDKSEIGAAITEIMSLFRREVFRCDDSTGAYALREDFAVNLQKAVSFLEGRQVKVLFPRASSMPPRIEAAYFDMNKRRCMFENTQAEAIHPTHQTWSTMYSRPFPLEKLEVDEDSSPKNVDLSKTLIEKLITKRYRYIVEKGKDPERMVLIWNHPTEAVSQLIEATNGMILITRNDWIRFVRPQIYNCSAFPSVTDWVLLFASPGIKTFNVFDMLVSKPTLFYSSRVELEGM